MRKFLFAGLALSAAFIVPHEAAALGNERPWCRIARDGGTRDCSFHSFAQCAASTERLDGGGCYETGNARGNSAYGGVAPARAKSTHRKRRHDDAN